MTVLGERRVISGPKILCVGGGYFDFENPEASEFTIQDVAHALSQICRFTGQAHRFYSVAEHSVWCSLVVPSEFALAALLHDAAEAFIGDVSSPLKGLLPDYKRIEARVEAAVLGRFGLSRPLPFPVKLADLYMLKVEQAQVMCNDDDWPAVRSIAGPPLTVEFWSPDEARARFLSRFEALMTGSDT